MVLSALNSGKEWASVRGIGITAAPGEFHGLTNELDILIPGRTTTLRIDTGFQRVLGVLGTTASRQKGIHLFTGRLVRTTRDIASGDSDKSCEGCDIVQSDHAPQAGVAQGIFHGDLIRRRDGQQVELEEELEEEVERRVRREHSRHQTQVRMHG